MHNKMFVSLIKVPLLDASSALELYQVHRLPIVNPSVNMSAPYHLETDKFVLSKDGLRYAIPSEIDYTKCTMASNHF